MLSCVGRTQCKCPIRWDSPFLPSLVDTFRLNKFEVKQVHENIFYGTNVINEFISYNKQLGTRHSFSYRSKETRGPMVLLRSPECIGYAELEQLGTRHSFSYRSKETRGPMVLLRSPECIGYAELEQAWKYMTICCISFHP